MLYNHKICLVLHATYKMGHTDQHAPLTTLRPSSTGIILQNPRIYDGLNSILLPQTIRHLLHSQFTFKEKRIGRLTPQIVAGKIQISQFYLGLITHPQPRQIQQ